jgi:hypothetical protein
MDSLIQYLHDSLEFTQPNSMNPQHICNCPLKTRNGNCDNYANYEIITAFDNTRIATCKKHLKANLYKLEFPGLAKVFYRHQPYERQIMSPIPTYHFPNRQTFDTKMLLKLIEINTEWSDCILRMHPTIQTIFDTNRQPLVEHERELENRRRQRLADLREQQNRNAVAQNTTQNIKSLVIYTKKIKDPKLVENMECSICYEMLDAHGCSSRLKTCSHMFHTKCIQELINYRILNCPLCRCYMAKNESFSV